MLRISTKNEYIRQKETHKAACKQPLCVQAVASVRWAIFQKKISEYFVGLPFAILTLPRGRGQRAHFRTGRLTLPSVALWPMMMGLENGTDCFAGL